MRPTARKADDKRPGIWPIIAWGTALTVAAVGVVLTPPGMLPYAPDSRYSDAAIAHWPNALFLREAVWIHHQWPLWNPTRMLGQPFSANPLSKVWYPPQWLVLILPPTLHLNTLIYLHLALLSLGMVAWARGRALHPLAAMFAAYSWALNPKLIAHLGAGHLDILYALAWTPWLLWSIDKLRDKTIPKWSVWVGVIAALVALADIRIAFYMFPVAGLYAVRRHGSETRGLSLKTTGIWLAAALVALLLTAVQTLPLIALAPYLTRSLITPQEASVYSLPPNYLLGMAIADAGGFHEWMTYLGLPVVGLAIVAGLRLERRERVMWWAAAGAAVLWSLGENGPLFMPVVRGIPAAGWFRAPSRAWFVVALALILLSALGLDHLLRIGLRGIGRVLAVSTGFGGIIWATAGAILHLPGNIIGAGAAAAATGTGIWLAGRGLDATRLRATRGDTILIGGGLLVAAQAISTLILDGSLIEGREVIGEQEARLAAEVEGDCQLVYSPSFDLLGPAAAQAHIPTLHGVDPFQLRWSAEAIADAAGTDPVGYSITAPPLPADAEKPEQALGAVEPDYPALRQLGTTYIVTRSPLAPDEITHYAASGGAYIYRLRQAAHFQCGEGPNRLHVLLGGPREAQASAIVIHAWAPGWRAWVDEEPAMLQRTEDGLIRVSLPAGEAREIDLVYQPLPDLAGMVISGVTALTLIGGWVARRVRGRGNA